MRRFPPVSPLAAFAMASIMAVMWSAPHTANAQPAQQAYVKAGNPQNQAQFGRAVAISGNTMVVGANQEGTGAAKSGAAYVFVRTGDTWTQQAFLKADNAQLNDEFGISVAISGDTIVVGAWNEDGNDVDNSAYNSGAAYVFTRSGTTWTQQAYLKQTYPGQDDSFGVSVGISGETIVVGASDEDSNAVGVNGDQNNDGRPRTGAAYVFTRTGTTWSQQAFLKASNPDTNDYFGTAVAIASNTIVVGAPFESSAAVAANGNQADNSLNKAGAAYVFKRTSGVWTQQAYLKANNTGAEDVFGTSVAVYSGPTGLETVVVGAPGEASNATIPGGNGANNSAPGAGAVYVFRPAVPYWVLQAYLKASNAEANDSFGSAVAVSVDAVAVGAPREYSNATGINGNQANNSNFFTGAVYLFSRAGTLWGQQAYVKASNSNAADEFGDRLAMSGARWWWVP